ncbi:acyl carrier protein (plasmid) [Agrobacterium sp. rho-8.1]|nr:acyl carrier protein [Agrobacterium sp. rho-8.1]
MIEQTISKDNIQDTIAGLISQLKGVSISSIPVTSLFTDLGITSLDMVSLVLRVEATFNIDLVGEGTTARDLSTLEALSERVATLTLTDQR